jgi:hypothetical protein
MPSKKKTTKTDDAWKNPADDSWKYQDSVINEHIQTVSEAKDKLAITDFIKDEAIHIGLYYTKQYDIPRSFIAKLVTDITAVCERDKDCLYYYELVRSEDVVKDIINHKIYAYLALMSIESGVTAPKPYATLTEITEYSKKPHYEKS